MHVPLHIIVIPLSLLLDTHARTAGVVTRKPSEKLLVLGSGEIAFGGQMDDVGLGCGYMNPTMIYQDQGAEGRGPPILPETATFSMLVFFVLYEVDVCLAAGSVISLSVANMSGAAQAQDQAIMTMCGRNGNGNMNGNEQQQLLESNHASREYESVSASNGCRICLGHRVRLGKKRGRVGCGEWRNMNRVERIGCGEVAEVDMRTMT